MSRSIEFRKGNIKAEPLALFSTEGISFYKVTYYKGSTDQGFGFIMHSLICVKPLPLGK